MIKYILILLFVIICSYIGGKIFLYTIQTEDKTRDSIEKFDTKELPPKLEKCLNDTLNEIKKTRKNKLIDESLNGTCAFEMNNDYLNILNPTQFDNNEMCCLNHNKCKPNTTVICGYGSTNYPDPETLTEFDKTNFMHSTVHYFTLQDYVNWLKCFKDNKSSLNYEHLKNLEKVLKGEKPIFNDHIKQSPFIPPITSSDYFSKKINNYEDEIVKNNVPTIPYNYDSYPTFSKNFQTLGLIGQKNNIEGKYSGKMVNDYIGSKMTRYNST